MERESVRALKLEIASEVFAPIADALLEKVLKPRLGMLKAIVPPLNRVALGVARGVAPGDFKLAVRIQSRSPIVQAVVADIVARAGAEVDVAFVGRVQAHPSGAAMGLRSVVRPLVIGASIAHVASDAGTIGLIARHRKTTRPVVLSNSHVLAQSGLAKPGAPVSQPGPADGGGVADRVGALLASSPLNTAGSNLIDCAIAVLDSSIAFDPTTVRGAGVLSLTPQPIDLVEAVRKLGRTSGLTAGTIRATEIDDIAVDYDVGTVVFDDQIEIVGTPGAPFSRPGDSGSLVFDGQMNAVGLLFAGNPQANGGAGVSYANPIGRVLAAMDIEGF